MLLRLPPTLLLPICCRRFYRRELRNCSRRRSKTAILELSPPLPLGPLGCCSSQRYHIASAFAACHCLHDQHYFYQQATGSAPCSATDSTTFVACIRGSLHFHRTAKLTHVQSHRLCCLRVHPLQPLLPRSALPPSHRCDLPPHGKNTERPTERATARATAIPHGQQKCDRISVKTNVASRLFAAA